MLSSLKTALLTSAVSLLWGCGFFTLEDDGMKPAAKPGTGGSTGTGGAGGTLGATGGAGAATGGAGGRGAGGAGGAAGIGGAMAGTGGAAMAGTGGMVGGAAGGGGMGSPGGVGGTPSTAGAGGTAGLSNMAGAGGGEPPMGCALLNPGAEAFAGHCYLAVSGAVNFSAAKAGCEALGDGAHLVTISSMSPLTQTEFDAENAFVFELGGSKETWIFATDGMSDHDAPNGTAYAWGNGEAMMLDKWRVDPMEPNNYNKACSNGDNCYEHCAAMLGADPGPAADWNDDLCETTKSYVCEWDTSGQP